MQNGIKFALNQVVELTRNAGPAQVRFLLFSPKGVTSEAMDRITKPDLEFWQSMSGAMNHVQRMLGKHIVSFEGVRSKYKRAIDQGQLAEAARSLKGVTNEEKTYALVDTHWTTPSTRGHKMLHPMVRHKSLQRVLHKLNREVLENKLQPPNRKANLRAQKRKPVVDLPAVERRNARALIRHIQILETHNVLVTLKQRGYATQSIKDTQPLYDELRYVSPSIYDEMQARLEKAKILPFGAVKSVWPEVKARLESDETLAELTKKEIPRVENILGKTYRTARRMAREVERQSKARVKQIRGQKRTSD